ncbi:MAG: hypothetical protein QNL91_01395 [Candidatus Krumholzibacteria bacterium]|nr:hypothetical protein [Candidatus Krumholzibacteria bacterium]
MILKSNTPVEFTSSPGSAKFAKSEDLDVLHSKWNRIQRKATTDILYIGKGDSIRSRVSQLARFGAGRAKNHAGGEWLWQVHNIGNAKVLMQSCPNGKQVGFENWLLEKFHREHGEYPLANRKGPDGDERWRPSAN